MTLSKPAHARLDNLNDLLRGLHKTSHHHPADYPKAVKAFMDLCMEDECPHVDDVREWAEGKGWSKQHARDLGEMAETVKCVLRELGRI